jgi:hypothetical protein
MDRHRLDVDSDPHTTFHSDTYPDPEPTPNFKFLTLNSQQCQCCSIFLACVIIFSNLVSTVYWLKWKQIRIWVGRPSMPIVTRIHNTVRKPFDPERSLLITYTQCLARLHFFHLLATHSFIIWSVADPWHFGVDPDPDLDPRIHASN